MKVKVNKKDLQEGVKKVLSEKRGSLPILTNYLLKAKGDRLYIYGTDLDVYTMYSIPALVEEEGVACVNSKKLTDISKVLPLSDVDFYLKENTLRITSGKTRYNLPTADHNDFPLFENIPEGAISLPAVEVLKGVNKTVYAASKEISRATLNGLCFSFVDNRLDIVATDGHRLSLYSINIDKGLEEKNKYIVPLKAILELKKVLADTLDVKIATTGENIFFAGEGWSIYTRLINGIFPDYNMVIPQNYNIVLSVLKGELLEALKRVSVATEEVTKPVGIDVQKGRIKITSISENTEAEDYIDTDYNGESFSIKFNGNYLIEAIEGIDSPVCFMKLTGRDTQAVIKPSDENETYLSIVMPMVG